MTIILDPHEATKAQAKHRKFKRYAESRTNAILQALHMLGNLSASEFYSHEPEDIEKIFTTILEKVMETRERFAEPDFTLEPPVPESFTHDEPLETGGLHVERLISKL